MNMNWNQILTAAEIEVYHALTAQIDPGFARKECEWYASRTLNQLSVAASQAWRANERTGYVLARSYAALRT